MRFELFAITSMAGVAMMTSGCAGTSVSKYTPTSSQYAVNQPVKDPDCYDASVMLGVDATRAKDISRKILTALDATIKSETSTEIAAQRNRHIGVLVGSGGEELNIKLTSVEAKKTFMTATTKTGFVGGAGQKAWSCKIVDEAVKLASP